MKTALVTTTINVPRVLELYRALNPDVMFFVAGDEKTPHEAYDFCANIPNCELYSPDRQRELGYACSELIGWNSIQRRNIATLEALKWGADIIVSIDDDNIPLPAYFWNFDFKISQFFTGIKAQPRNNWFDVGQLLNPKASHRGFPHRIKGESQFTHVVNAKVGVAAGICLGDPDISAVERLANGPTVHGVSELLRAGIVADPKETRTVFNSQNTAIVRDLAPAFFMLPGTGRYDDILASLLVQTLAAEQDYVVHFGMPFVWQQRNEHNLVKDLRNELHGMETIERFAYFLDNFPFGSRDPVEQMRAVFKAFDSAPNSFDPLSKQTVEAGLAWCEDLAKVY